MKDSKEHTRILFPMIVALGGFCWFLLLSRWLQRYTWGAKLTRFQPFKFFDWMYRAFVKS